MVRKNKVIFVSSVVILLSVCPADSQRLRYQQKNDFRSNVRLVHGGGDVVPMTSDESLGDNSFPVLPLCCDMVKDDVVSYQCQNTLGKSSQEVLFKRKTWVAPGHLVSNKKTLKFKFVSTSLFCKNEIFSANLPLTRPHMPKQSRSSYFSPDGYFKHQNEYYRPDEYCISGLNENRLQVKICRANCSNPATPCIQKCCGIHQIYSFGYGDNPRGCVDVGSHKPQWFPTLYHDLTTKLSPEDLSALNPHIIHKFPTTFKFNCRFNKTTVFPHSTGISDFLTALTSKTFRNLEFRLRKDGWLLYPGDHHSGVSAKRIDNYCVDGAQDYGESSEFGNLEGETVLFLCSGGVDEGKVNKRVGVEGATVLLDDSSQNSMNNDASEALSLEQDDLKVTEKPPEVTQNPIISNNRGEMEYFIPLSNKKLQQQVKNQYRFPVYRKKNE